MVANIIKKHPNNLEWHHIRPELLQQFINRAHFEQIFKAVEGRQFEFLCYMVWFLRVDLISFWVVCIIKFFFFSFVW